MTNLIIILISKLNFPCTILQSYHLLFLFHFIFGQLHFFKSNTYRCSNLWIHQYNILINRSIWLLSAAVHGIHHHRKRTLPLVQVVPSSHISTSLACVRCRLSQVVHTHIPNYLFNIWEFVNDGSVAGEKLVSFSLG